ncbi:MAG: hypothetical protein KGZ70_05845 [Hydrogenophaga sp.]|uniref:hypothetical protein n=1 Tax=Hydrogenophaga sp. TaxID=1904254 RepID=UPI001BBD5813|nr:hypothetical protein [Hydrogenophaga sp.]MBS3911343.1 hypothetical protein [Hydrogenophaga sp.]MDP2165540.1 hypothetical protein [Hydrogenophaga sp.]MDP3474646.1 hypothetical protein [Hydrogenophaga sp.]
MDLRLKTAGQAWRPCSITLRRLPHGSALLCGTGIAEQAPSRPDHIAVDGQVIARRLRCVLRLRHCIVTNQRVECFKGERLRTQAPCGHRLSGFLMDGTRRTHDPGSVCGALGVDLESLPLSQRHQQVQRKRSANPSIRRKLKLRISGLLAPLEYCPTLPIQY